MVVLLLAGCQSSQKKSSETETTNDLGFIWDQRQFTFAGRRAGEGYFSADGRYLIFQSERETHNPFYQIYLTDMQTQETTRVSPGFGKTTCSWVHPSNKKVLFASTHQDPKLRAKVKAEWLERKEPKKRYNWSFDDQYEIYESAPDGRHLKNLTRSPGYDAEASYSPDGQWIAFASNRTGFDSQLSAEDKKQFSEHPELFMEIYIMKADGTQVRRLTHNMGYDGGPFFSPDGKRLTFRRFSPDGHTAEIYIMNVDGSDQKQVTRLGKMSWAPFYHPSGDYLVFTSNLYGYENFELFIVDVEGKQNPIRITNQPGFDGLPVFTPKGTELFWTYNPPHQEAQIYRAAWDDSRARKALGLPAATTMEKLPAKLTNQERERRLRQTVEYLTQEKFAGRPTGFELEPEYTAYLTEQLRSYGLAPYKGKYIHEYSFTNGVSLQPNTKIELKIGDQVYGLTAENDWIPASFSENAKNVSGDMVFVGYGIVAPKQGQNELFDSYDGVSAKGKWVVAFNGIPEDIEQAKRFHLNLFARTQHKAMVASQKGAIGLILIDDAATPSTSLKLKFEGREERAGIPVLRMGRNQAESLLKEMGTTLEKATDHLKSGAAQAGPIPNVRLTADYSLEFKRGTARNVLAKLPVKGTKRSILVGAHLDHLGHGQFGNSLKPDANKPHPGADDNASGVAAVLEIAKLMAASPRRDQFKQNLVFALWTGEEIGTLGSSNFIKTHPPKEFMATVNLDMVGRLRDNLVLQGVASSRAWKPMIERVSARSNIALLTTEDPYLPTDSISFYLKGVPSISLFTGSHSQYHTPDDKADLINYEGMSRIVSWTAELVTQLAEAPRSLPYEKVKGSAQSPAGGSRNFRLYLGTIPDYTQDNVKGVLLSGTSKNSPAEKAGLKAGDVLLELGGMKLNNIHDFVYCLQALKANQTVAVRILREGQPLELSITPQLKSQH